MPVPAPARLVLIHGSVVGPKATWAAARRLRERYELVAPTRRGFPPGPPAGRVDFEQEAELVVALLADGAHLVGHSYGGVICLLAAALAPELVSSLTVIEPPCFAVAAGDPAVDALVAEMIELWERGPREPEAFLRSFLAMVGSAPPPGPLSPQLVAGARTLMNERGPWEAQIPLVALAAAPFPKLVVSGGHSAAFDAVCDVLERSLGAERSTVAGAEHGVTRLPAFVEALERFLERADARR